MLSDVIVQFLSTIFSNIVFTITMQVDSKSIQYIDIFIFQSLSKQLTCWSVIVLKHQIHVLRILLFFFSNRKIIEKLYFLWFVHYTFITKTNNWSSNIHIRYHRTSTKDKSKEHGLPVINDSTLCLNYWY